MNILKKILLAATGSLAVFSCDFLDVEPLDSFGDKAVFSSFPMINAYVSARYNEIWTPQSRSALRHACDETMESFNWGGINGLQQGYMNPDYWTELQNVWASYYSAVQSCNVFLDQEESLRAELAINPDEEAKLNRYFGEAKFLRAFFYSELMARYGDIIIADKAFALDMGYEDMYLPRTPYDKCVEYVTTDLDQAAEWLPVSYKDAEFGHATKGAALALKARVLLYAASPLHNPNNDASKWNDAKEAIEDIIFLNTDGTSDKNSGTKVYELDPDFGGLFDNPSSREIIFQRLFNTEFGHLCDAFNSPNSMGGYAATCVNQELADQFEIAATGKLPEYTDLYGANNGTAGKEYEAGTTPWDGRDPRFYATIGQDGSVWKGHTLEMWMLARNGKETDKGGADSGGTNANENWNSPKTRLLMKKLCDMNIGGIDAGVWNDKSTKSWVFFRLGEMYLNYAEALYKTGDESGAREYLNKIRDRARGGNKNILPDITASGEELWKAIMHERRVELAFEEHRFFDVRRWMLPAEDFSRGIWGVSILKDEDTGKMTYKRFKVLDTGVSLPQNYYFAIPRSEAQKNKNLTLEPYN